MAEIVAAAATSHILMSPAGAEGPAAAVFDGMLEIGRAIRAARPDVLVVISSDHLFNIGPEQTAPFLVACADRFVPFGDMDIPREAYPGQPEWARAFVDYASARHESASRFPSSACGGNRLRSTACDIALDPSGAARAARSSNRGRRVACGSAVTVLDDYRPDHGVAVPLLFANVDHDIPVVPLLVNYDHCPPAPAEAWRLGCCLGDFILQRPAKERVAVLAGGGLSHWVGYEGAAINEDFDQEFLRACESGQLDAWRTRPGEDIRELAGNGGLEVISWMMMAATVPGARARTVYYQPMPSWMTGMGGVIMRLERGGKV